jgi:protein tyrosine kinase modulator
MHEVFSQLVTGLVQVWRRRWIILAVAWMVSVAGWMVVAVIPDRYESSARIYIDTQSLLQPLMKGITVDMNLSQQIDIMKRTLLSRPNLEKLLLMTDQDLSVNSPGEKEQLLVDMASRIKMTSERENLFKVSVEDINPELAKRTVQSLLSIFVESNLGVRRSDMDQTQTFLEAQVADYARQLEDAERKVADFKQQNLELLPGSGSFSNLLEESRGTLGGTQAQLTDAISARDLLKQQLAAIPQLLTVQTGATAAGGYVEALPSDLLRVRISDVERQIDDLLLRYTEKHPDVAANRRLVEELNVRLEAALATEAAEAAAAESGGGVQEAAAPGTATVPNPVYEQLQVQLVRQESDIGQLQLRLSRARESVAALEQRATTALYVENEFKKLQRDYEIIRSRYEELRSRLESAKLANELETKTNKVQFRIIDPPEVPIKPVGPNRPGLLSGVLVGSLAAGIGLAFLLGQLRGSFPSVTKLRDAFPLPILGGVSMVLSPADRRRHALALASFGVVLAGLLTTFGGLIAVETLSGAMVTRVMEFADRLHLTFIFEFLRGLLQRANLA